MGDFGVKSVKWFMCGLFLVCSLLSKGSFSSNLAAVGLTPVYFLEECLLMFNSKVNKKPF